jgi:hypothetical protein
MSDIQARAFFYVKYLKGESAIPPSPKGDTVSWRNYL